MTRSRAIAASVRSSVYPSLRFTAAGASELGARESNQDQFLIADLEQAPAIRATTISALAKVPPREASSHRLLSIIADGVGGQDHGDLASEMVVRFIEKRLRYALHVRRGQRRSGSVQKILASAALDAHSALRDRSLEEGLAGPPCTTATVCFLEGRKLHLSHVGDCRAYLTRDGKIRRATRDHTMAAEMRSQHILPSGADVPVRWEHILTNVLGGQNPPRPDVRTLQLRSGDTILLCSDGLTRVLDSKLIADLTSAEGSASAVCDALMDAARARQPPDNTTIIVMRME